MSTQQVRPSRVWYWIAGASGVCSIIWLALGIVIGFASLGSEIDGFQRVPLPGTGVVTFTEPGSYVLYYEEGQNGETVGWFNISLTPVDGDGSAQLHEYVGSLTFDMSGHAGKAIKTISVEKPGKFVLQTVLTTPGGQDYVSVGKDFSGDIVRTVIVTVAGTFVLFFGGVAIVVVVAIRRSRARRRLLTASVQEPAGPASPL